MTVRFTVLCNDEPIGHVQLDPRKVAAGDASGDLEPLPAYEQVRPVLERAHRAMRDAAVPISPLQDNRQHVGSRQGGKIEARVLTLEEARSLMPDETARVEEAMLLAKDLRFALLDEQGAVVRVEDVYVWTALELPDGSQAPPRVDAIF